MLESHGSGLSGVRLQHWKYHLAVYEGEWRGSLRVGSRYETRYTHHNASQIANLALLDVIAKWNVIVQSMRKNDNSKHRSSL